MWDEIAAISEGLIAIKRNIFDFIKKVLVFIFLYGRMIFIPLCLAFCAYFILDFIGINEQHSSAICKAILILGQIFPAASYAGVISNDPNAEGSMDICFAGAIIVSLIIWYVL